MNKYFEYEDVLKKTESEINNLLSDIKELQKNIDTIKKLCDHTDKNGKSSITRESDRGHGHTIYTCNVCGEWRYSPF
jgi:DNA repair exonuclease SbcCD ATPase subunit